ncbi:aspartate racemase (plasmid) [Rhizobium freirei PRF 81]|uniref:Aspartate racemase n=1 Tax=Rhizobium freirei PRF 81 TaxID=363754 RepID=N6TTP6_9HYPH|nr:aspartate racemase [Rhizobium freirei PRF 81]
MHQKSLIGILGGMGPTATVDFLSKVISATKADVDQEHIPLIVHDVPQIPDRSSAIENGRDDPFLPMLAGIRLLDAAGVEFIAIPCNTAHYWHGRLQRGCRAKILHIADAVAHYVTQMAERPRTIAVMATRGTISGGIYSQRLLEGAEQVLVPDEGTQLLIDRAITGVKANQISAARKAATEAAGLLADAGADCLLLACTELPVALSDFDHGPLIMDATEALARACVRASVGEARMETVG